MSVNVNFAIKDLVLSPFSMMHSTYSQPLSTEKHHDFASGYNFYDLQLPGGFNIMPELAAAGLWTTPSDLAQFGIEIMKALKGESKYLGKSSAELMTTKAYENSPHGVGFAVNQCKYGLAFGHGGSNPGYNSTMCFYPDEGSGIVVMQNSDIGFGICDEVLNAYQETGDS